jgi:hypothetical protein
MMANGSFPVLDHLAITMGTPPRSEYPHGNISTGIMIFPRSMPQKSAMCAKQNKGNTDDSEPGVHGGEGFAKKIGESIDGARGVKERIRVREGPEINRVGIVVNHLPAQDADLSLWMSMNDEQP